MFTRLGVFVDEKSNRVDDGPKEKDLTRSMMVIKGKQDQKHK